MKIGRLFMCLLAGGVATAVSSCRPARRSAPSGASPAAVKVRVAPPVEREFREVARLHGVLRAAREARLAARVAGPLEQVMVDVGDTVTNGQPLFVVDRVALGHQLEMARQDLRVTEAGVEEARAAVRRAEAAAEKASVDHERLDRLYRQDGVVARDLWEKAALAHREAAAALDHAVAALALAEARREQAAAALGIAGRRWDDSTGVAPFDAVVAARLAEPGEYVGPGTSVVVLKGLDGVEARVHVPAAWYELVRPGRTTAEVSAGGRRLGEFPVSQRAGAVHPTTRTFEVRLALPGVTDLADGLACEVALILNRRRAAGVPVSAVGLRGGGMVVFTVEDGRARPRAVRAGIRDQGHVELLDAAGLAGAQIVVEGQTFLEDGTPVEVVP